MKQIIALLCLVALVCACVSAQTNPAPQAISYTQDFGTAVFTTPKQGMASWTGSGTRPYTTQAAAEASLGGADIAIFGSTPTNGGTAGQYGHAPSSNGRLTILQSSNATNGTSQVVLAINTTGITAATVSYDLILTIANARTVGIAIQYRVGTSGSFTTITGSPALYNSTSTNGGDPDGTSDFDNYSFSLPAPALDQPEVQLRWITWRGTEAGNSSGIGIDNISVTASSVPTIAPSPTSLSGFTSTVGNFSASQVLSVTGSNLTNNIEVSVTSGYEISADGISGYSSSLTLNQSGGTVNAPVYIRISTSPPQGTLNGTATLTSAGADDKTVPLSGTVNPAVVVNPPQSFTALAVSTSEIDLTSTANAANDNVLIAYNTVNVFGTPPVPALPPGSTIPGGGTILVSGGPAGNFAHTGLAAATTYYYSIWSVDGASNYSSPLTANATTNAGPPPNIVVNQVYGGGGNSGALYKNDFIELLNNENFPVNLSGWSVQYQSSSGTGTWSTTALNGMIPPHGFYLVQELAGNGGTTNLPTPDAIGSIAMGATAGKVILSNATTALTGASPTGINVIDKVGYGSANGFETAPTAAPDNTTSVLRIVDGVDNNNNSTDFKVAAPVPRNSSYTTSAPVVTSFSPPNNSLNVPYNIVPTVVFDKPIQKGTGSITFFENGVPAITIDVTSPAIAISNNTTATISTTLTGGKSYYVLIDAGAFKDVYGNDFAGINNSTTWTFTTYNSSVPVTIPITFDFQNCSGSGLLPDGFTQFSVSGNTLWDCTPFGRDPSAPTGTTQFPNGVQINGFANGTNIPNIDWLISPSINLTATSYPLLSFWSRTAFNGQPLQLKISTDYVSGDPLVATWTDLNGKFPTQTSNTWTLSSNINLSAFKQSNVHFAFVYTSTNEDGARWTVDDIQLDNSATPPPPSLTVGTTDIQFNFVASGSTGDKTFSFIGNDLTDDVVLVSTGAFLISKDGVNFYSQLQYSAEEANNLVEIVHVRFAPTQPEQNYTGLVSVTTGDLSSTVNLKGSSIDPATTLEVVNWNLEWFGSTDPSLGPTNDDLQEQNVKTVLQNANADIYGLVEVVDESRLANIVSQMPGYGYVICNYGSHTNPFEAGASPISEAQKEAFIYKTSMFSNLTTTALCTDGVNTAADLSNPAYNYFSSGRYPFMMTADVTMNGITKTIRFVLLHAKANTSPTATAYVRRKAGADTLKYTLNTLYPNDNILILGDFNDDLDSTITDGIHPRITSYYSFTHDTVTTFFSPTLALSLAGKKSTVSFNDMIDHVMLSNELEPYYMPATANVLTDVTGLVNNYGSTTSDHFPVFTRYMFCKLTCPESAVVSNDAGQCGATVNFNVSASMICGSVSAVPPSGSFFPVGATPVQVTASTGETCSFMVTVTDNENPAIIAPANIEVNNDPGKCYATIANLGAAITSDNCGVQSVTNDAPQNGQFPMGISTVTWTVTDIHGNIAIASQTITVADNENPALICAANQTRNTDPNKCSYAASGAEFDAAATDNCAGITLLNNYNSSNTLAGAVFNKGQTTVIWTATDAVGNTASCSVTITVEDHQAPSITAPSAVNVSPNNTGCTAINVPLGNPTATDNCPGVTFSNNASATFPLGITVVTWTATDASGNSATATQDVIVSVSLPIVSSISDEYAVNPGGSVNTIYIGYGPSTLTLHGSVSGGAGGYSYKWTVGSSAGPALSSTSSYTISPTTKSTYYFNVKDQFGCAAPPVTKTINVVDVRCGAKSDKVTICQLVKGKPTTSCVASNTVAAALAGGAYLGPCVNSITQASATAEVSSTLLTVSASPNPSGNYFTINMHGGTSEKLRLRVTDMLGRMLEQKENIQPNATIRIGNNYHPGVYIVELIQGKVLRQLKLIKVGN